jgi:hypothetical protein
MAMESTAKQSPTTIHRLIRALGICGFQLGCELDACAVIAAASDVCALHHTQTLTGRILQDRGANNFFLGSPKQSGFSFRSANQKFGGE